MDTAALDFVGVTDLAAIAGRPRWVIEYAVRLPEAPRPAARVGLTRLWSKRDLPVILNLLERTRRPREPALVRET